ncbi:endonuclease/exonuclease/phosphatase family protein [Chitinilyticum litopenaei]|uniref:endonuclease/exonuclease/phosphatase family protein n=1 Tax=Chitinilyticum litopenaei TaxID=1121276 RepID=UPI00040B48FA|nr:endonuclease/exonuclease/phosphatase family protein [Chitinilyticum litopenaei]
MRNSLRALAWLAALATVPGLAAALDWRLELFSHFLPLYLLLTLAGLGLARYWPERLALLLAALAQLGWLLLALQPGKIDAVVSRGMPLQLIAFNGYVNNPDRVLAAQALLREGPELLLLTEADAGWQAALQPLAAAMPHGCARHDDSPFGIALLAKQPLRHCAVKTVAGLPGWLPYVCAELASGLVVYGIHPPPPLGAELAGWRDAMLDGLAGQIAAETAPVLVLGDFNSTPYSPVYLRFRQRARLQETGAAGWPSWGPPGWPALLPLDRVLARGVRVNARIGPALGSDHRLLRLGVGG